MKISALERRDGKPYAADATGWVVESRTRDGDHEHVGYWCGPSSGWGTTYAPLTVDPCWTVRVWPTKHDAEMALRRQYGPPRKWGSNRVVRVEDAGAETTTTDTS
ncbi:MAG: hypothetical protein J2P17_14380 [Mycobacterium sp.]|nr:hypothetical protein [Mycobacterium sp.]